PIKDPPRPFEEWPAVIWVVLGVAVLLSLPAVVAALLVGVQVHLRRHYLDFVARILQEKPLFIIPRGQPAPAAEDVRFPNGHGQGRSAGLLAAADDPRVRCVVTDGAFAVYTTMVPYMRKWFNIYNDRYLLHGLLPTWYYGLVAMAGVRRVERERGVHFPHVE